MTAERERIVSLQILRFIAAMMVVVSHGRYLPLVIGSTSPPWFWNGAVMGVAGVDIFFVLSGFVIAMTGPLATPRPSGALFFWRRWRRVAPVYFVISLPFVVLAAGSGGLSFDRLAATFLFWPAAGAKATMPYLGLGWTLCYEMAFYSFVALVLVGGRLGRNLWLGGAVIAGLVIARMLGDAAWLRWLANPMFLEFAAGVALARLRRPIAALGARLGVPLILAGAAAFAVEFGIGVGEIIGDPWLVLNGGGLWPRLLLYGVPAAVIVAGAVAVEPWAHGRLAAVLAIGGDASYAIYLTHPLAMQQLGLVWRTLHGPRWPLALVAAGAVSALVGGLLTWWVIERPILRDLKRLSLAWPPWRAAAVATPT